MNDVPASSGSLSNSWCLVNGEAAAAAAPAAEEQPTLPASSASSSDHSDFEIFDEDEGGAVSQAAEPPLAPSDFAAGGRESEEAPAIEAPRPLPRQERRAQERRLLLALRSLRGDAAAGSATPSPLEPPTNQMGPVSVRQEPPRIQIIQHNSEEESLPESDIQLEDAQNMAGGPELFEELMEGDRVRRYQHSPNAHLNARLNGLVMCAVLFVLGLAVGHFLGSTHERFSNHFERVDRNDRIKSMQTELLQCARKYDELELQLNEVKATLVQKEYVDKWESLYQEGEEEKAALTATMNLYKSRYNTQKQLLTQCELRFGDLEERIAKEKVRNIRCQPCPKVDLSCPRELDAVKASLRAVLELSGSTKVRPLPCDLTALLPSWPTLRASLSNRLQNATALLMKALPADWTKLHGELLRSPGQLWSKMTGRKTMKTTKHAPKRDESAEKAEQKRNHTDVPPQPTASEQRKVNWFLKRRSTEAGQGEAHKRKDSSWFWRDRDAEDKAGPTSNGFWYWRMKGKKLPPLSTEYIRPPAMRSPPATTEPVPPATTKREPPAMKDRKPPVMEGNVPAMDDQKMSEESPTSGGDDWPLPGDIDDETNPSDWLEAFMQMREQMMRAQLRIWRSLKQMASKNKGRRQHKAKKRRKRKKTRKQKMWTWDSEGK